MTGARSQTDGALAQVGVVAIGRNEGERLKRCLASVPTGPPNGVAAVVYVDSGSTDGSVEYVRGLGLQAVELDMATPFTAARARNAGIERLRELLPTLTYVQVLDGDCMLAPGWLEHAFERLQQDPGLAVVCGRRREVAPEQSVYNLLCDMEWNTEVGPASACGGDAMIRLSALREVGGYDPEIIAGEEPEMCFRLRARGHRVERLDHEMTAHDAQMTRFSQWWKRNQRAGHAYAEGAARYGSTPERYYVRELRSFLLWGLAVPLAAIGLSPVTSGLSLLLLAGYPVLGYRILRYRLRAFADPPRDAALYAGFCVLGKLPGMLGVLQYWANARLGRKTRIIEYKGA